MRKKSILMVCISALIALAVFVGCDNAPVYPAWPTGAILNQKVDLIEGQIIPSDAFDAIVTYTDGTSKTIKDVAVTGSNGIATNGVKVYVVVGYNTNDTPVSAEGDIVAIPVDHIEATVVEGTQFIYTEVEEGYVAEPVSKNSVVVNAVTADGLSYRISQADYTVALGTAEIAEDDETVETTLVITALGENQNDFSTSVDVVAGIDREPADPFYAVSSTSTFAIAPFNYEEGEMPVISFDNVDVKGFYGDSISGAPVSVAVDPGLVFSGLLDERTKLPIGTTDLTSIAADDLTFAINYNDNATVYGNVVYSDVTVEIEYLGNGLFVGDNLPSADQFRVLVSIDDVFEEITPENASLKFYVQNEGSWANYTGTTVPEGGVYVHYNYRGIDSATPTYVSDEPSTVVESISLTLKDDAEGPAKQIHTVAPVFDVNNIASVTITTKTGDADSVTSVVAAPYDGFTFEYSTTPTTVTALKDGVDLSAVDNIYVIATYKDEDVTKVDTKEISTSTPNAATGIVLSTNDYDLATGASVEWTIAVVNEEGIIEYLLKDEYDSNRYSVWLNGNTTGVALPEEVTVAEQGPYYVTYNGFESNRVTVEAGGGYVIPGDFTVGLKTVKPVIGNLIPGEASEYVVTGGWTESASGDVAEPVVYSIRKSSSDQRFEASSTVYARVSYIGSTGETVISDEIEVTITGIAWTEEDSVVLVGVGYPEIQEGYTYVGTTYTYGNFAAGGTSHGTDTMLCVVGWYEGTWDNDEASLNKTDVPDFGWDRTVNFVIRYTDSNGDVAYKTFPLVNTSRPAATN